MRPRYWLRFDVEIPAKDLGQAIERALRLFRPSVRTGLKQTAAYCGSYRGSFLSLTKLREPPADRINLQKRRRKLRRAGGAA